MSEDVRTRKCPWRHCTHRIDEDGDVVHMKEGIRFDTDQEMYTGGKFGSIIATIDVEQRAKSATVMEYCVDHGILADVSDLPHPCELNLTRGGHGTPCYLAQVNVEISELPT